MDVDHTAWTKHDDDDRHDDDVEYKVRGRLLMKRNLFIHCLMNIITVTTAATGLIEKDTVNDKEETVYFAFALRVSIPAVIAVSILGFGRCTGKVVKANQPLHSLSSQSLQSVVGLPSTFLFPRFILGKETSESGMFFLSLTVGRYTCDVTLASKQSLCPRIRL